MNLAHATPRAATAASRRLPLYLYGRKPTQVEEDGPALLVRVADQAPARYPFTRIARVIAGARVEWRAAALAACQRESLPIVFLDAAGEPTGYLQPALEKPSRLDAVIEEMLDRADWAMHYQHWLRSRRMRLLGEWLDARQAEGREIAQQRIRELIRQHVYQADRERFDFAPGSPQAAALTALTLQTLQHAGAKARYWGAHGGLLDLAGDLAHLLGLALHLEMHGLGSGAHGEDAALLRVLHSFGPRLAKLVPSLLGNLHRRFKSQLEEWR